MYRVHAPIGARIPCMSLLERIRWPASSPEPFYVRFILQVYFHSIGICQYVTFYCAMLFSDVIGQYEVKQQLHRMLDESRMPHALLFAGPEGCGKLPMALALASRLLCQQPTSEGEPCCHCPACKMTTKLAHPDLHLIFPVFKPTGQNGSAVSSLYLKEWRAQIKDTPYFSRQAWLARIGVANQQSLISVAEANHILSELSVASSQGGYRVIIIWLAEQMNQEAANKLLKILEEPPSRTVFILTADHPEQLLPTILSRTQRIDFRPLQTEEMTQALQERNGLQPDDARLVARASNGSYTKALEQVKSDADTAQFFDIFVLFMRLCYMRKLKELNDLALQLSQWGREKQKAFLEYAQHLIRENFIFNFHQPTLNYMNRQESEFATRFARFINERNVIGMMEETANAQRDIEQNANARMVFFDLAMKTIVLLIQ